VFPGGGDWCRGAEPAGDWVPLKIARRRARAGDDGEDDLQRTRWRVERRDCGGTTRPSSNGWSTELSTYRGTQAPRREVPRPSCVAVSARCRCRRTRTGIVLAGDHEPPAGPAQWIMSLERSSARWRRRRYRTLDSSGRNRRPEPHGQGSRPPSFSMSSVSSRTRRTPRLTWVSLEGTPGGVCWSAQKDASAS
jgi:hypothetical protein